MFFMIYHNYIKYLFKGGKIPYLIKPSKCKIIYNEYEHKTHIEKLKELVYCDYLYEEDAYNKFCKMVDDISDDDNLNVDIMNSYLQ